MSRIKTALLALVASAAMAAPALAQDFAITNATLATGEVRDPIPNASVVVRGGQVVAAGPNVPVPADIRVIDGTGMWVTPGLFSPLTDLGLWDVAAVDESNDRSAGRSPFSAALDFSVAINPANQHIMSSRAGGVTRASVIGYPSGSIFAGQGAIIDLGADRDVVTRPRAFQMVAIGETGGRLAGGSRVAAHALLRNALREARDFGARSGIRGGELRPGNVRTGDDLPLDPRLADDATDRGTDVELSRFDAAALVPVVNGSQPLYVQVDRAADILAALALKEEFAALDLVLVGAAEGWMVAERIAAAGVPVIAAALLDLPERFEQLASTQSNIGRMVDAGVTVAIGPFMDMEQPRYAPQYAGNLVGLSRLDGATGLSWGEAFAAISSIPAQISGQGGRSGVLAPGAHGDAVLWDGDPLEISSAPVRVFIDGVEQPLDNHQTRLRERYRDLDESQLPKAYVH
ncbi:amidohydrolase family protein [Croceicoccus sp. YJ47]|uniref:amidohydrolase family protein n=1 Tax=Croceicoccus sp. YJ47 TaxID=2798724 RepID=UPI0019247293|nr:amidohydrolase family protein [Croceicoccus sp. YJ47]QQN73309.1 amidohydrolase family protein [Croceicoccus sp. YJ47]